MGVYAFEESLTVSAPAALEVGTWAVRKDKALKQREDIQHGP